MFFRAQAFVKIGRFAVLLSAADRLPSPRLPEKFPRSNRAGRGLWSRPDTCGLEHPLAKGSPLTEDGVRVQREAIGSIQGILLTELAGTPCDRAPL